MEAEAGGGCSPTYFSSPARCCSLFCTQVGVGCSTRFLGRKKHPSTFSIFDQVFDTRRSQVELVVELPKFLASVREIFLGEGRSGGPGSPTFIPHHHPMWV